jgi:tRNA G18 (ribose-2'-O)-methylase SpoU
MLLNIYQVMNSDDPRIAVFAGLKDHELARQGQRFIAEGEHLMRRLLASSYATESVLLSERRAEELSPLVPPDVPVYVAPTTVLNQIVGFNFTRAFSPAACGGQNER